MLESELKKIKELDMECNNIKEEDIEMFVPPIKFGKVIKINTESITIVSKLVFLKDGNLNSSLNKFFVHLEGINMLKLIQGKEKCSTVLKRMILNRVIEVRNLNMNNSKLYAQIYMDNININDYLVDNKYTIKVIPKKIRRMSEPLYMFNKHVVNVDYNSLITNKSSLPQIDTNIRPNTSGTNGTIIETDCFLSHNWGENKENHILVANINNELIKRGLKTWFDEEKIEGNIRYKMAEGIDNTKCVVVFITKEYRDKVNSIDMRDNAKYEFTYSMSQHGSQYMIPVIMDSDMRDTKKWKGELGAALGSILYVDLSESTELDKKYDDLYKRIKHIVTKRTLPSISSNS